MYVGTSKKEKCGRAKRKERKKMEGKKESNDHRSRAI